MYKVLIVATLATVSFSDIAAALTCTQQKNNCIAGSWSRGARDFSNCNQGFEACMQTGVWDLRWTGPFGRRIKGMIRR